MRINVIGPFRVNHPFATEIAFSKGLRQNGNEVIEFDPNCDSPDVLDREADFTLVFKNALSHNEILKEMPGVVLYQPDDLRFEHIQRMVSEMRQYTEHLLVFRDYRNYELPSAAREFSTVNRLMVVADPDIYYPEDIEKDVDFCFVGSLGDMSCHWQRHSMVEMLNKRGHKVLFGQTNDVNEIRQAYCRSKVVLNHAAEQFEKFGWGHGFQCRHFEVGLTRSCLLSNCVMGEDETNSGRQESLSGFCRFYDQTSFIDWAECLLDDEKVRQNFADQFYEEMLEKHTPAIRAKQLTDILESL